MTKDEIYSLAVNNYYHDLEEYTDAFKRGDITEAHYRKLVNYAREFWLSENNQ